MQTFFIAIAVHLATRCKHALVEVLGHTDLPANALAMLPSPRATPDTRCAVLMWSPLDGVKLFHAENEGGDKIESSWELYKNVDTDQRDALLLRCINSELAAYYARQLGC